MSKGLEALEKIDFDLNYETTDDNGYSLKTPIKARDIFEKEISVIEKELKAFDIVISKIQLGGFIDSLQKTKNYEEYKNTYITLLTEEEYDLLKEVLK